MFRFTSSVLCNLPRFGGTVHIPSHYRKEIERIFRSAAEMSPYEYAKIEEIEKKAGDVMRANLPNKILSALVEVRDKDRGFVEITGCPKDPELPETPIQQGVFEKQKKTFVAELTCLGLANLFHSKIYNFRQEGWGTGSLIFNIFPQKHLASLKGAGGNENDFRLHMENAWHHQTPDGLILKGLRPDHEKNAITYAIANGTIIESLSDGEIAELKKAQFWLKPPEIHKRMEEEKGIPFAADREYHGPVLLQEEGGICLRTNFNGMGVTTQSSAAEKALRVFEAVARSLADEVRLDADNLVLINNRRALHTRNGYTPRYDGNDRLFQRYFLISPEKLWRNSEVSNLDFPFLNGSETKTLLQHLNETGILNREILTEKFKPYEESFSLELPSALKKHEALILKILIRKGPAFPNRVV